MNQSAARSWWQTARDETPGVGQVIHFNNAAAALMPTAVLERCKEHLDLESQIGPSEAAEMVKDEEGRVYEYLARLINCREDEIALLDSASRAWAMAFHSIPFQTGDRILTCQTEYASNYIAFLQLARRYGLQLEVIPDDESGCFSIQELRRCMDERVKLVAVTHVAANSGQVNPVQEIGSVLNGSESFFLVDASLSVGQLAVDVQTIGCDFLSATGRKYLRGPRGTGFLFISHRALGSVEPPLLDLHSASWTAPDRMHVRPDAKCFEMAEYNVAARLALATAVAKTLELGMERIETRIVELADGLRRRLQAVRGLRLLETGSRPSGIVSFTTDRFDPQELMEGLRRLRINLAAVPARNTLIDMNRRGLAAVLRASLHYYNSHDEIDRFVGELERLLS